MKPMTVVLLVVTVMVTVLLVLGVSLFHHTETKIETHRSDLAQVMADLH